MGVYAFLKGPILLLARRQAIMLGLREQSPQFVDKFRIASTAVLKEADN